MHHHLRHLSTLWVMYNIKKKIKEKSVLKMLNSSFKVEMLSDIKLPRVHEGNLIAA